MLKETYCSYEVSKLLKEKGFNEKCRGCYHSEFDDNGNPIVMFEEWMAQPYNNDFADEGFLCSAPTHQMAMAWLREVHKLHITILWDCGACIGKNSFWYRIDRIDNYEDKGYNKIGFDSYEEAVEAALKYCLENFI